MTNLIKYLYLPYFEKVVFAQSFVLLVIIRLSLWVLPFSILKNLFLKKTEISVKNQPIDLKIVNIVVKAVTKCGGMIPFASCLTRAITAQILLKKLHQSSELKIGIKKSEPNKLEAHAWIEIDGRIIIGKLSQHQNYRALISSTSLV